MPDSSDASRAVPARYKLLSPARLPIPRRPVIVPPRGLGSPDALLESPVLLTQVKAEPSPTTGTFFMPFTLPYRPSPRGESTPSNQNPLRNPVPEVSSRPGSGLARQDSTPIRQKQAADEEDPFYDLTLSISPSTTSDVRRQTENRKPEMPSAPESSPEEVYMWSEYRQRLVSGSEQTSPAYQVKKQPERSHNGQTTDIIYRDTHDQPRPPPAHQPSSDVTRPLQEDERNDRPPVMEDDVPQHVLYANTLGAATAQPFATGSNDVEAAVGALSEDDPGMKRRREDAASHQDDTPSGKAIREPRVVVQTLSEIDVLDDGYRWRKYGQKVVKGNPNPRSYYKCTNAGCGVRKHVERASHDPKAVITTYEGKHNHDVPSLRSTGHDMTSSPMAISIDNDKLSQVSAFFGAPAMYDATRSLPPHCHKSGGANEIISLDLEVGLSPRYNNRDDSMLRPQLTGQIPHFNIHMAGSNGNIPVLRATSVAPVYGGLSTRLEYYVPGEGRGERLNFDAIPTSPSCGAYKASMGSLVAGP